ncbi:glycosyltransferase family 2 protein [Flaviaesturariibacter aridisoli]|uniref:Glycosyltransferase family 2 protein n=1 Tax=Flaviaesturariibacter aridisoli TaxID=2545761 RepID=A0A4R4E0D4_9BACT|nr:glycosyltransferase family 2 protein [Flaviaesturariibacter aridisoli]TCZ70605.1 glycosyltransferase family 2 protein [Flaviaesturariibacter aridisoli]
MPAATPISVVVITRNEAANIMDCLRSARALSDDIVVVDCGSNDATTRLAALCRARVQIHTWQGYGAARNLGAALARHDWILALDADERLDENLITQLKNQILERGRVYRFRRRNHWEERPIRFGTLGFERIARLYHRGDARWNGYAVHERLTGAFRVQDVPGNIQHFGIADPDFYYRKKEHYALLSALTYARQGKKAGLLKRFVAPLFDAVKSYLLLAGFLDGAIGARLALTTFRYTARKYALLHRQRERLLKLERQPGRNGPDEAACMIAELKPLPSSAAS